jgi:branched-subunit amino acid ABC-type transport system permease component
VTGWQPLSPKGRESLVRQHAIRAVGLLVVVVAAGWSGVGSASAATDAPAQEDKVHIVGTLDDTRTDPPSPVEGVLIQVYDEQDELVGEDRSNAKGRFDIPLPGTSIDVLGNSYRVVLDDETLPENSYLTDPDDVERTFDIKTDQNYAVNFDIGPDIFAEDPWYEKTADLAVSGIVLGLLLALASLGLSLVFGTTGLTNFSHGELFTFGALAAFFFDSEIGVPLILAALLAVVVSAGLGWAQDAGLWRPLRRRGTGIIAMMIISIGLSLVLRNLYQYFMGPEPKNYTQYTAVEPWTIGPIEITPKDLAAALICTAVLVAVSIVVTRTRLGKATRAVADNPALAASSGINVDRVVTLVWISGTALAGLGGIMFGLTQGFDYQVGYKVLLLMFAAVILGGLGTIWGVMAGSLIVGLAVEESALFVSAEFKYALALGLLIIVLLVRPQGILGRRERVG